MFDFILDYVFNSKCIAYSGPAARATCLPLALWVLAVALRRVSVTFEVFEVLEVLNQKIERLIKRSVEQSKDSIAVNEDVAGKDTGLKGVLISVSVSAK